MEKNDSLYISRLRGASILRVVLGHLGLGWVFLPFSSYIGIFLPVLFFCSGYLFYWMYLGYKKSIASFLIRRLSSILIPFYFVYCIAVIVACIFSSAYVHDNINIRHLLRVIIVAPNIHEMPYNLGQIWYLRVLLFATVICPVIFYFGKINKYFLLIPVALALVLSIAQSFSPVHKYFYLSGYNFFQVFVYSSYFYIGSFAYSVKWRDNRNIIMAGIVLTFLIAVSYWYITKCSLDLSRHGFAPDLYYFSLGVMGLAIVLYFADQIEYFFSNKVLAFILDYSGKYSYGIFLTHSFFIVMLERYWGFKDVMKSPGLAFVKIALVLVLSFLVAYPIGKITTVLLEPIKRLTKG